MQALFTGTTLLFFNNQPTTQFTIHLLLKTSIETVKQTTHHRIPKSTQPTAYLTPSIVPLFRRASQSTNESLHQARRRTVDVIQTGREILFQAFNWESHKHDWWSSLAEKVTDLAKSGFTSVWLPPVTQSCAPEGYLPQNLYSLDSSYGSDHLLRFLLQSMRQHFVRPMADIVINHRVGTTQGHGGSYNRYDGIPLPWDERAVTSCSGGLSHRQKIINWIDKTGGVCAAFDFTTKGILQEAVNGELWRLRDSKGKPPGVMGWWPSRAITFIENHDTGSTQGHWLFPSDHVMEGYAYILTHPGMPTVFYDHFYDWGDSLHDQIVKLISIRKNQEIHSRSKIKILEAQSNLYSAMIDEKLCMKIGDGSWCPSGKEWILATSGHRYAVWHKK